MLQYYFNNKKLINHTWPCSNTLSGTRRGANPCQPSGGIWNRQRNKNLSLRATGQTLATSVKNRKAKKASQMKYETKIRNWRYPAAFRKYSTSLLLIQASLSLLLLFATKKSIKYTQLPRKTVKSYRKKCHRAEGGGTCKELSFPGGLDGKESACNAGDRGSIPESGRSPERGHGNPLQYSCLGSLVGYSPWGHKSQT